MEARRAGHLPARRLTVEPLTDRTVPSASLLLATAGDVSGGPPGLAAWTAGTAVRFGDPNFALEPGGTSGTFSALADLDELGDGDVKIAALHHVRRPITVGGGTNTLTLLPGDLLLSTADDETLTDLNSLSVKKDEVFVFRPAAPGDYSSGSFLMLLDNFKAVTGGDETWAIALVERDTAVGDVTLTAGTFLLSRKGGSEDNDVMWFVPTGVGAGSTAGAVTVLIEGDDLGVSKKLYGLELVETAATLGDRSLLAGTLLLSLDGNDSVGSTSIPVNEGDVFALAVTRTTLGGGTAVATTSLVFRGSDVGLDGEKLHGVSFTAAGAAANTPPAAAGDGYVAIRDNTRTVPAPGVFANDTDPDGDPLSAALAAGPTHGTAVVNLDGSFAYTPSAGYTGPDSFTYTVTDGRGGTATGTVNLTVVQAGLLVVDTTSDAADGNTSSVAALLLNKGADGRISLREAIRAANNTPNAGTPNRIHFNIPGGGPHVIAVQAPLPTVTGSVVLDATTDPDFAGTPVVVLDGQAAGANTTGLTVTAGGTTLRGLVIQRFGRYGVVLSGGGGNVVEGNYIGIDVTGAVARPNGYVGLEVNNSANNRIGGTTPAQRNVISGNASDGVDIIGAGATGNVVEGNYIGTNATGTAPLGNGHNGVWVSNGASNNRVGGPAAGAGNVIADNAEEGVEVQGGTVTGTVIQGNRIGTDATGTVALGNHGNGILVQGALNTAVGGPAAGAGNVIAGSGLAGVRVFGSTAVGTVIHGNRIGTDRTGTLDLGNGSHGVLLTDNGDGVTDAGYPTNTTVGGPAAGAGNTIRSNAGGGVVIGGGTGTAVRGNAVSDNAGQGIDLGGNGVTANDPADADLGPNRLQNFPTLSAAYLSGGNLVVSGHLRSLGLTPYVLDFYASPTADGSGHGEGSRYLGSAAVSTNLGGNRSFTLPFLNAGVANGEYVTATATDPNGNTSEFGPVARINSVPAAGADGYTTLEDNPLAVPAGTGLLVNDMDPDGDSLTAALVAGPAHGSVVVSPDGSFTYTPDAHFFGSDSFTYTVTDGRGGTSTGTVAITVTPVNDAPNFNLAGNPPAVTEDSGPRTVSNFAYAIRVGPGPGGSPATPQTVVFVVTDNTNPGLFAAGPDISRTGTLTYTPAPDASGTATITVVLMDDGGTANGGSDTSAPLTFVIRVNAVNDVPTLDPVGDRTVAVDVGAQPVTLSGISAGGGESQGLQVTAVSNNPAVVPHPAVTYASPDGAGTLTFQPAPTATRTATITVTVRDAGQNGTVGDGDDRTVRRQFVVTVTAVGVEPPPTLDPLADLTIDEDAGSQVVPLTSISAGDAQVRTLTVTATSDNPALIAHPTVGYASPDATGTLTFTPTANAFGSTVITVTVNDGDGTVTRVFAVTVNPVDDAPVARGDRFVTAQGVLLAVNPAGGVLANDTDADLDSLTVVPVDGPAHGTLTLNPDGSFGYTPGARFVGTDSFTYQVTNEQAASNVVKVTIHVRPPATRDDAVAEPEVKPSEPDAGVKPPAEEQPAPDPEAGGGGSTPRPQTAVASPPPTAAAPPAVLDTYFISLAPAGPVPDAPAAPGGPGAGGFVAPSRASPPVVVPPAPGIPAPAESPPPGPILVAPPQVGSPAPAPAPPAAVEDELITGLNELDRQVRSAGPGESVPEMMVVSGVVATAGYVFLSPRLALWLVGAVAARRTVLKPLDPLAVVYAWERDGHDRRSAADDESLESMVGK